jgi:membrane protein implicated in regulation of membrane protease activity
MEYSTLWWILAGLAVAVELMTGTFYLLMFALGLAAAAVGAHFGVSLSVQFVLASLVGGGAVIAWHFLRAKKATAEHAEFNSDVNMDIGQSIYIETWQADGMASVKYRGSSWTAQLQVGSASDAGNYRIEHVVGSRLIVKKL